MPKLFVPVSYVDEQTALLKKEIAGLKKELEDLKGGHVNLTQITVVDGDEPNKQEEVDPTASGSAGFVAYREDNSPNKRSEASPKSGGSPKSPTGPTSPIDVKRTSLRQASTQSISHLGGDRTKMALVCFDRKSAWSIPLVITVDNFEELFDAFLAMVLLLTNILMQGLFIGIIQDSAFLGEEYSNQVDSARTWRASFAHDAKYVDLTDRSLASRVCNEDGSLIFSNGQVEILSQINAFLGMGKDQFDLPWLQPGVMLSVLCILLWDLCIFKEYRSVWHALQGLYHVEKSTKTTFGEGALQSMSRLRVATIGAVCVVRLIVATLLMINGSIWLSRTTSISELMLNAVALEAVIHVDEFLFSGLTPTRLQFRIQNLPPVRVPQTSSKSLFENFVMTLLMIGAFVLPFTLLVKPLSDTMVEVKHEMCAGNRTFIVSFNSDTQQTIGRVTRPIDALSEVTKPMVQVAVEEHIFAVPEYDEERNITEIIERYIDFTDNDHGFETWVSQSMDDYGANFPICLEEWLGENGWKESAEGTGTLVRKWDLHFRSAKTLLGKPNATKCSELAEFCDLPEARLLRFACGVTCKCDQLYVNPLYRTRSHGCNQGCLQNIWGMSPINHQRDRYVDFETNCEDVPRDHPAFVGFFREYMDALTYMTNIDFDGFRIVDTKSYRDLYLNGVILWRGCAEIRQYDDLTNVFWCRGHAGLYRPLAWLCPQSCGCTRRSVDDTERNEYCFAHNYCPFTVPANKTKQEGKTFLMRRDLYRLFLHTPQIQFGGVKLP